MGRLVRDPQIRVYGEDDDKKMARFTIACDRRGKKEEGQQTADFIGCICYGKTADFVDQYLRQGTKIVVNGEIRTGKYEDKDGRTVFTTDVLVNHIEFAESKRASEQGGQCDQASAPSSAYDRIEAQAVKEETTNFVDVPDGLEEELPW